MTIQYISAIDLPGPARWKDERRGDQRIGVLIPDRVLRTPVKHGQHPVVARKVGKIPCYGSISLRQRVGTIDQRDVVEFGAADALGLHDPEQARIMQIAFGFRRQSPQRFGFGSALAQRRNQCPGPCDNGGVAVRARSGGRTCIWPAAVSRHERFLARSVVATQMLSSVTSLPPDRQ